MNFWQQLHTPFFVLAPMDDVTDAAFRHIIAAHSKAHSGAYVTFTEFTSADGLVHADEKGQRRLRAKLRYSEIERPVVAQLFSSTPKNMEHAAALARELGFDGIDINMGCPDRSVEKQGAGSALIRNPEHAQEIIHATKSGAGDLPVSVKTRIGYTKNELATWLPNLLAAKLAAVTIHARTRNELSKVPARWEHIKEAVAIRDAITSSSETRIIGNGDVQSLAHARELIAKSGADGAMLGRAMFGNPWVMCEHQPTTAEKIQALIEHTELFEKEFTDIKSFAIMRKHFASYIEGFDGAKEVRTKLMACDTAQEVKDILKTVQV